MTDLNTCIEIKNLNKTYHISKKGISVKEKLLDLLTNKNKNVVRALKNVNLSVHTGDFIGILGHNGSGKTTLLKSILGCIDPDKGSTVITKGKIIRLALGKGFDISLSARDNIYLSGTMLGLSFQEIGDRFDDIVDFAELEKFVDTPVKFFSSGMVSRLSFSIAIQANADIYLIDEFFADVGDKRFQEKAHRAFKDKIGSGKTVLHVSHSEELLKKYCNRYLLLHQGVCSTHEDLDQALTEYNRLYK